MGILSTSADFRQGCLFSSPALSKKAAGRVLCAVICARGRAVAVFPFVKFSHELEAIIAPKNLKESFTLVVRRFLPNALQDGSGKAKIHYVIMEEEPECSSDLPSADSLERINARTLERSCAHNNALTEPFAVELGVYQPSKVGRRSKPLGGYDAMACQR